MKKSKSFPLLSRDRATVCMLLGVGLLVIPVWGLFHRPYDPDVPIPKEYHFQVDLNNASAIELQTLPGIGEKLAEGIVLHRQDEGPFRIPKDLTKVKGIGPKKLEAVTPYLLDLPALNSSNEEPDAPRFE